MLVIFDCDGVLVDTELLSAQVFSSELSSVGVNMSAEACIAQFKGHTLERCYQWIELNYVSSLIDGRLPKDFPQKIDEATLVALSGSAQAISGVEEFIQKLIRLNISFCVASNGGHEKIRCSLESSGLIQYFSQNRFSVDDVKKGKPAPDLFLFAAESLGVPEKFCWVIEDSLSGVHAARSAGMNVIAYTPECDRSLKIDESVRLARTMGEVSEIILGENNN